MMNLEQQPITRRILLGILATSLATLLLATIGLEVGDWILMRRDLGGVMTTRARVVAANCTSSLAFRNAQDGAEVLSSMKADLRVRRAALYDAEGALFATYPADASAANFPSQPEPAGHRYMPGSLLVFQPVLQGEESLGTLFLESDLSALYEEFWVASGIAAVVLIFAASVSYVISKYFGSWVSLPILNLAKTARRVTETEDFSVRSSIDSEDELGELAQAFNHMLAAIEERGSALAQSEARFRSLLNSCAEGIYGLDQDGRCTFANPACAGSLGYESGEDLLGRPMHELIHHSRRDGTPYAVEECPIYQAVARGKPAHVDGEVFWRRDGNSFPTEYWAYPRVIDGEVCGAVVTFFDITEREAGESRRRALMDRIKQSNQELEQFAYVASHDLQEPLRMVSSYTQLLARRYQDKLDQDAREFIEFAVDGTNRMQRLINDLLDFSRVGTRGRPFEERDLNELLSIVRSTLTLTLEESGGTLTHDPLPTLSVDPGQITQLFQNLITNAIKFRKPDEPPRVHITADDQESFWALSVADNGIGIEPQYFERIFEIFQRLHGPSEFAGTGIGLSICKRIIERHGGKIWVASEPGQGTTFHFTLSKAIPKEMTQTNPEP